MPTDNRILQQETLFCFAGKRIFLEEKCIFLYESAFFCMRVHFSAGKPLFSAVYSRGLRIISGSLILDDYRTGAFEKIKTSQKSPDKRKGTQFAHC